MNGSSQYKVVTAYTLSQYRTYNRTVQRYISRIDLKIAGSFAFYLIVGVVFGCIVGSLLWALPFAVLGLVNVWWTVRGLRRAESAQYQQEQMVGTVTYLFGSDSVEITSHIGSSVYGYDSVTNVFENDDAFYIMFASNNGAILPKEDCPPGLDDMIRSRFPVKRVRSR